MLSPKDIAYRHIRGRIASGRLGGADRISDYLIAAELGVSRGPVREAISQLASEGVVELMPGLGAFVRMLSRHELVTLRRFRVLMECDAVAEAAARITPPQLARLRALLRETIACARLLIAGSAPRRQSSKLLALDQAFHLEIVRAAGNPWVLKAVREQQTLVQTLGIAAWVPDEGTATSLKRVVRSHHRLLAALTRRDPRAAADAMRQHLSAGAELSVEEYNRVMERPRKQLKSRRRSHWPQALLSRVARREAAGEPAAT